MPISISSLSLNTYNRISGLETGLDTEAIVDGLTLAEQSKVIAAHREKQLLIWKRDAYREIIEKLNGFYNKYFSQSADMLQSLFSKFSTKNTGSQYLSVAAGGNLSSKTVIIKDIVSLASASRLVSSDPVTKPLAITVDIERTGELAGKSMKITLDGVEKTLTFSDGIYGTIESVRDALQNLLDGSFGTGRVTVEADGNTLTLKSPGNTIILGKTDEGDISGIFDFTDGQRSSLSLSDTLANSPLGVPPGDSGTFKINGVEFNFSSDYTLTDIINMVNSSDAGVTMTYSSIEDKFILTSKTTGAGVGIALEDVSGSLLHSLFGSGELTEGTNAVIKINTNPSSPNISDLDFITVVKSSNTFEIDGITYNLTGKADGDIEENIRIDIEFDTEGVLSSIRQFVEDYNSLLKSITDKLSEPKYRDFPPLTDEQRKELGPEKAAEHDLKAKSGLLRSDSYLKAIETALRNAVYSEVSQLFDSGGSGITLFEIGITTGKYSDKGQLKIDETRLRQALLKKPEEIAKLFTQKSSVIYSPYNTDPEKLQKRFNESGLLYRISDIIQNNTLITRGALTKLVGSSENDYSSLYTVKLRNLDSKIELLKKKLKEKQEYYWMKFSKLESALSTINKQSAYLFSLTTQQGS